jgi:HPr kinase/phosphorylase
MITNRTLSIAQLFQDHIEKLKLNWVAAVGVERLVELNDLETFGPDVVGHLNMATPDRRHHGGQAAGADRR